jgi:hypothetical protein
MLAAGFSIKALNNDVIQGPGKYRRELKTIAAFNIILMLMPLLHLLNLCAFRNPVVSAMFMFVTSASVLAFSEYFAALLRASLCGVVRCTLLCAAVNTVACSIVNTSVESQHQSQASTYRPSHTLL